MRDCLSVHMPVSKLEGRNCGVPNQWWVNSLYVGIFPFTFYGQLWAQCLVYIMGVGGIWNTGLSYVVMHNSEWKFSFLWIFFTFFIFYWCVVLSGKNFSPLDLDSLMEFLYDPVAVVAAWVCCRGQGRTSCPLPRGSVGGDVGEL